MSGVKGRSGGARPGAGAKRKITADEQGSRRDVVLSVLDVETWRATVTEWVQAARETRNFGLLFPLLPYLMGSPKQEIKVSGQIDHVQMDAAKHVLRVVGGTEKKAAS